MMKRLLEIHDGAANAYHAATAYAYHFVLRNQNVILLTVGTVLLLQGLSDLCQADGFTAAGGGVSVGPCAGSGCGVAFGPGNAGGGTAVGPAAAGGGLGGG